MRRYVPLVVMMLSIATARTQATVVVAATLGELARDARAIPRGRVVAVEGRWTDDRRTIETLVTLDVDGYLKGSLGDTVQFRVPGGQLGRFRSVVVGAPEFTVGQRVILFLGASGPMIPYILGMNQGVYRISATSDGTGWLVTPPALLPSASGGRIVRGDPSRQPLALADFESQIRSLAGGAK
jgi:hypothetical protein